jgi:hypothetical protein
MHTSIVHHVGLSHWRIVMSIFGDALSLAKNVGGRVVNGAEHLAEDSYKLATDGSYREQAWNSALNDVKAAANFGKDAIRSVDAAKDKLGSAIDSGEQYLENKVDDGRAWLWQHGGVGGEELSDQIGVGEGVARSLYDAGKGVVQIADGASSLMNPLEWAANPDANVDRIKLAANSVKSLGKVASLADPASWVTNPKGNEQLASALWNSAATSFKNDPSKFVGNLVGTIGTLAVPGADAAGLAGDAGRAAELARGAEAITQDAGKAVAVTDDTGKVAAITGDAGKTAALPGDAGEAAAAGTSAEKPVQITLRGVEHTVPDWHLQEISYTKRTDAAREALRDAFPPVRKAFVKGLAENLTDALRQAGMSDADVAMMAKGRIPKGYQVHHLLPIDDGGTNATSNLVLIKNDPDHMLMTNYQNKLTQGISAGQTRQLEWPMPDKQVSVWPETPGGGAYPTKH